MSISYIIYKEGLYPRFSNWNWNNWNYRNNWNTQVTSHFSTRPSSALLVILSVVEGSKKWGTRNCHSVEPPANFKQP